VIAAVGGCSSYHRASGLVTGVFVTKDGGETWDATDSDLFDDVNLKGAHMYGKSTDPNPSCPDGADEQHTSFGFVQRLSFAENLSPRKRWEVEPSSHWIQESHTNILT
jgi:hypothetical protein